MGNDCKLWKLNVHGLTDFAIKTLLNRLHYVDHDAFEPRAEQSVDLLFELFEVSWLSCRLPLALFQSAFQLLNVFLQQHFFIVLGLVQC